MPDDTQGEADAQAIAALTLLLDVAQKLRAATSNGFNVLAIQRASEAARSALREAGYSNP